MAKILGKDPVTYAKERDGFLRELHHFHESRGTPFRRAPILSGHEIDLYLLYSLVTEQGGWIKVNSKNGWHELYEHFRVPGKCVNGSVALKQIYLRYLDRWEKVHYLGEEADRGSDDDEESRHKRWSARALHSVPLTYNYSQHNITESTRDYNHLSTDLYKASDYDRLALSLLSPLPNEQDFAINVCTLLSNDGKHTLKIERHPRIVDYLVAHAGVFSHPSMRAVFEDSYNKVRRHPINTFWNEVIESEEFLDLTNEKKYSCSETVRAVATGGIEPGIPLSDVPAESDEKVVATEVQRTPSSGNSNLENVISDFYECCSDSDLNDERFKLRLGPTDSELFSLGRNLGTRDYIGQRVLQVATILRNLSFIDENVPILSNNRTFVRFMLLCLCSRWGPLQNLGFDMLGNISSEFQVKDPQNDRLATHLLKIVTVGLKSEDRSSCISCLDALNKLSQNELNEDSLTRALESLVYERVCTFLTIHDVMLLIYTLECLYSLSSLGERACNYIVNNHGVVDTLVSLVTVEGKSYGPKACIGMKLVETVPGGSLATQPGATSTVTNVSGTSSSIPASSANTPTTVVSSISTKSGNLSNTPQRVVQMAPQRLITITPTSQSSTTTPITIQPTAGSPQATPAITPQQMVQQQHAHQQAIQENEQFALAWLRATYEPSNNGRVDHQELYKHYINSCAKIGRRGVIAPLHFPRCVRSVFGGTVGPNPVKPAMPSDPQYYDGIKARAQPLSVNVQQQQPSVTTTTNTSVAVQSPSKSIASTAKRKASTVSLSVTADCSDTPPASPASPILKAQLSAPPKPRESTVTVTTTATTTNIVVSTNTSTVVLTNKSDPKSQVMAHPHLSQALLGTGQNASSSTGGKELGTGQPNTSLIKSLLATKVTTECMTAVSMKTATDSQTVTTQVVARQQQQRLLAQQTQTPENKLNKSTLIETPKGIRLNGARQLFSDTDTTESDVTSTTQNTTSNIRKEPPQPPPPPLAPLSSQKPKHMRIENEDSDSTGNNSLASSTGLGNIGMGGVSSTEDGDNSLTSFEGLLNGIPSIDNPLNDDSNSKDSVKNSLKKPLMLAELLEKKVDKDTLMMNGVLGKELRKGEKSVDLVENHIDKILSKENNLNEAREQCGFIEEDSNCINVKLNENKISLKRAASDDLPSEPEAKKPLLLTNVNGNADSPAPDSVASSNGDDQPTEKVSTAAAKLFADMAADILEDEDVDELMQEVQQPTTVSPPIPVEEPSSVVISSQSNVMSQTSSVPQVFVDGNQQVLLTQPTRQIIVSQPQLKTQSGQVIVQNPQQQRPGQIILQQANTGQILLSQGLQGPVQLVASSTQPGQYVIQTSGTQNYMVAQPQTAMVHGQPQTVLVAQTPQQQGTNTKTIIILQQPSQQQKVVVTPQGQQVVVTQVQRPILQSSSVSNNNNNNQSSTSGGIIKSAASQCTSTITTTITAEKKTEEIKVSPKPKIIRDLTTPFVCEWGDCQIETKFKSANQVYLHVCEMHVPKGSEEIMCQWDRCDNMKRKRFSLMTHLNDKHCNTEAMRASLTRRKQAQHSGKSETASTSAVAPPHPGYAPDAAFHAIKRHALEFVNPKELQDDNEGPVTKSIRLTASLILRNLVIYSSNCRRYLKHYEPHLANVALSNVESSRTIAQVLYDMNDVSSSHR
ncbi:AT-rich interactive domain-containing protein 2 isoform X2 [Onthophagus taurus]|uniref:AT-rich interactive domain-containing protein 2 isoform X2 n=1 Tax=Onthophagus taurus TaxID=166361 RepID=UPI000C205AA6|nr:AT-rich interactive domain-containing protein 2 isoform X2 [Onthophagus taurus]